MKSWENLESKTRSFVQSLEAQGGPPIYKLSVEAARNVLNQAQAGAKVGNLAVEVQDEVLPVGPSGKVSVRIVKPSGKSGRLPVAMYFHGGGWILGNQNTHDRLIREIVSGSEVAIVFVNYTPSPEARFPVPIEEAYAATKYIAENGERFGLDTSRLAVIGDSVGGNMATVVALMAKERKGPSIHLQMLFYPVTDSNFETPSYREFSDGPWLTREAMKWFWNAYLPDENARRNPLASPLQAPLEQLKGLPKTLLFTDENDVLRDEGEAYAHHLMNAGVDVTAIRFNGTIHDFMMLNGIADTPAVRAAIGGACVMLRNELWGAQAREEAALRRTA